MSDDDQPTEAADPAEAPRETVVYVRPDSPEVGRTVAFTPEPAATRVRPPAPPPPPAPPAPPPSFRVTPAPGSGTADAAIEAPLDESSTAVDEAAPEDEAAETATTTAAVVQAERAAAAAAAGPRQIVPIETEDDHRGRNILISILIVLVVAAIVAAVIIAI